MPPSSIRDWHQRAKSRDLGSGFGRLCGQRLSTLCILRRERHADDARALSVFLTKDGWAAHQRAMEGVAPFCEALAALVPPDEGEMLLGHLNRIAGGMSATDSPPIRGRAGVR